MKARYTPVSTVQCVMDRRANKPAAKKQTPLGRASVVTREISEQLLRTGVHAAISTALRSGAVKKPTSLAGRGYSTIQPRLKAPLSLHWASIL